MNEVLLRSYGNQNAKRDVTVKKHDDLAGSPGRAVRPGVQQGPGEGGLQYSGATEAFARVCHKVAGLVQPIERQQQAGILSQLLGSVNPASLTGLGGGLAALLKGGSTVSPQQASQITP